MLLFCCKSDSRPANWSKQVDAAAPPPPGVSASPNKLKWGNYGSQSAASAPHFLFFLRRLKVFGASQNIMFLFYQAVTESVIRYGMTVWFGSLSTQSKSKLQRLVQTVMKVMWRTDRLSLLVHLWAVCTQAGTEGIVRPVPHPSNGIRALAFRQKVQNPQRQIEPF